MYELVQVTEKTYYIQSPAKIGLVKLDSDNVCLIDSGNDKEAGRKVKKLLDSNGWHLSAIYNTHSNADHIGGNKYLQSNTGCKIYAPDVECAFTRHTVLEPSIDTVNEVADTIAGICRTPTNFERILQVLFTEYGLIMNFEQYVLAGSTVRSYLSWLKDNGRLSAYFEDNMLLWSSEG